MQKGIAKTSTRTAQIAHHIINRAMNDAVAMGAVYPQPRRRGADP